MLPERPPALDSVVPVPEIVPSDLASIAGTEPAPVEYTGDVDPAQPDLSAGGPEGPDGNSAALSGDAGETSSVADLIGSVATACPILRRLYAGPDEVIVSIGFDVDVEGVVDSATMHVVQSPAKPLDERQHYTHRYSVGTRDKVDRALRALAPAYDSVVTADVRQHVAALQFRPALRNGRPIRSSVLISCHSP